MDRLLKQIPGLVAACALCACANVIWLRTPVNPPEVAETAPAPTPAEAAAPPAHKENAAIRRHKPKVHKREEPVDEDEEASPQMSVVPDLPMDSPPAIISMAGGADALGAAQQSLDATNRKLAAIDRARLSPGAVTTYDQAKGLLTQGKQALADKDYVAASGFARKASALAARLPPPRPAP